MHYSIKSLFLLPVVFPLWSWGVVGEMVLTSHSSVGFHTYDSSDRPYDVIPSSSGRYAWATTKSNQGFLLTDKAVPRSDSSQVWRKSAFTFDDKYFITSVYERPQTPYDSHIIIQNMKTGKQRTLTEDYYFEGVLADSRTAIFENSRSSLVLMNLETLKVIQEIPARKSAYYGHYFRSGIKISTHGKIWANFLPELVLDPSSYVTFYELNKTEPLLDLRLPDYSKPRSFSMTSNGEAAFVYLLGEDRWLHIDVKNKKIGCDFETLPGMEIYELSAAGNTVVGILKPESLFCDAKDAGCRLVKWDISTCQITGNVENPIYSIYDSAWIDQDQLLLYSYYSSEPTFAVANFATGQVKNTSMIDGYDYIEANLSKGSREIFALASDRQQHHDAIRFLKVSFDSMKFPSAKAKK